MESSQERLINQSLILGIVGGELLAKWYVGQLL